jgi:hypothetical protein
VSGVWPKPRLAERGKSGRAMRARWRPKRARGEVGGPARDGVAIYAQSKGLDVPGLKGKREALTHGASICSLALSFSCLMRIADLPVADLRNPHNPVRHGLDKVRTYQGRLISTCTVSV